jgi:hypothetical protein
MPESPELRATAEFAGAAQAASVLHGNGIIHLLKITPRLSSAGATSMFSFSSWRRMVRHGSSRLAHSVRPRKGTQRRPCSFRLELLEDRVVPANPPPTFAALTHQAPASIGEMMLLGNGTVMGQGGGETNTWYNLSPDTSGNFFDGTWSPLASMNVSRLYFGSAVLPGAASATPDSTVFVIGGEYATDKSFSNSAEMYDPNTNTWTMLQSFQTGTGNSSFGDDPVEVLGNGTLLLGYVNGPQTYTFDPNAVANQQYTPTKGAKLYNDQSDEEAWVKLKDGSILSYDIFSSLNYSGQNPTMAFQAQRYVPQQDAWVDASTLAATSTLTGTSLSTPTLGYELGPAFLLPDGRVFQIGATNHTAFYDPTTNLWSNGPDIPGGYGSDDAPGAVMTNGHVIFVADAGPFSGTFSPPAHMFDFDPTTNTITDITTTLPAALQSSLTANPAYITRMVQLPNGQVLFSDGADTQLYVITPPGNPPYQAAWQPAITGILQLGPRRYQLTGTQLTGLDEGAAYGDDVMMASNYPIVALETGGGNITYANAYDWYSAVATGNLVETVDFTIPNSINDQIYPTYVVANGIPSAVFTGLTIQPTSLPNATPGVPYNTATMSPTATLTVQNG